MIDLQPDLRNQTIDALYEGLPGLREFQKSFQSCSDSFEQGEDHQGRSQLIETLPHLQDFAAFCDAVLGNCGTWLSDQDTGSLQEANAQLEEALKRLLEALAEKDVTTMSDVLRYNLCELMDRYAELFPVLADGLRRMENSESA